MARKKSVEDVDVRGKRVLVRVDFNVPQDKSGAITDDTRIRVSLPTIQYLRDKGAKVILCSHLGRPDGKVVEKMRMGPVAARLSQLLGTPVQTVKDCVGPEVKKAVSRLKGREVLLLENLRFHSEEEENDPSFSRSLAKLADIYVNDAFGTAHRAHASTEGVTKYLPAVAGFLMQKELQALGQAIESPARPFAAVVGGAKVEDKIALLENIAGKVNSLLVGGGMVATFLKAGSGGQDATTASVKKVMEKAKKNGVKVLLASDVVVARSADAPETAKEVAVGEVHEGWAIVDIGPLTIKEFSAELTRCKTVLWNGPMGIFEVPRFARGTEAIAKTLAGLKAVTIIGGGSTAEAVNGMKLGDKMTHVSTGGGAVLMFLEGRELPGVAALLDN